MPSYIYTFRGSYDFLSNFFIEPDGTHVEGEYQAHKIDPPVPGLLQDKTPQQCKAIGRSFDKRGKTRKDWRDVNIGIMQRLVFQKFCDHDSLRIKLINTGDAILQEGNWWGDEFWGMVEVYGKWQGENHLGKILMSVRNWL